MVDYYVKNNTEEELEELRKQGYYPNGDVMGFRGKCVFIPDSVIPADSDIVDSTKTFTLNRTNGILIYFGHQSFNFVEEGTPVPVVGRCRKSAVREKE